MYGYYVEGAPVLCMHNVQATRHLVNGTRALMHSLIFDAHEQQSTIASATLDHHEETLLHEPKAINVVFGATPRHTAF